MKNSFVVVSLGGLALSIAGSSCNPDVRFANVNHCANQNGNEWCLNRGHPDGSRPYCILGNGVCGPTPGQDGCVEELPSEDCYSPCGYSMTVVEDAACLEGETSTGTTVPTGPSDGMNESSSSTTGPAPCVGDNECTSGDAPFCDPVDGVCVGCNGLEDGDAACAGFDSQMPVCDQTDGVCVQCTAELPGACSGDTPVCDGESRTCVPCTEHGQCGEAACNLFSGACLPADAVAHVGGPDSEMPEFSTLAAAVGSFEGDGTVIVHQGSYSETLVVDGGRTVAFLASEGALPFWILPGGGSPQLAVADATVLLEGLQVSGNDSTDSPGVRVDGGQAWMDRSRIVNNGGGGILAQNDAELVLRNCYVGGDRNNVSALEINGATANVVYSTLGAGLGTATALTCDATATVSVRNSLMVASTNTSEVLCAGVFEYCASEAELRGNNTTLGEMTDTTWFTGFASGDFGLTLMRPSEIDEAAQWRTGDPKTDIDGDPRPTEDGTRDFVGADIP